jgi:hypothetical protein
MDYIEIRLDTSESWNHWRRRWQKRRARVYSPCARTPENIQAAVSQKLSQTYSRQRRVRRPASRFVRPAPLVAQAQPNEMEDLMDEDAGEFFGVGGQISIERDASFPDERAGMNRTPAIG